MRGVILHHMIDPDDSQGCTYKQINLAKLHTIPIGTLVDIRSSGCRLFVVAYDRDCDGTPLYELSADKENTERRREGFRNPGWVGGYSEGSLTVCDWRCSECGYLAGTKDAAERCHGANATKSEGPTR